MPESRFFCCTWTMVGFGKGGGDGGHDRNGGIVAETLQTSVVADSRMSPNCNNDNDNSMITITEFAECLDNGDKSTFVLDCRPTNDYENLHIINSINVSLPTILKKRLNKGTLSACSAISAKDRRDHFAEIYTNDNLSSVVLIEEIDNKNDNNNNNSRTFSSGHDVDVSDSSPLSHVLYKKLWDEGCHAKFLRGGINKFFAEHPDLCRRSSSTNDLTKDDFSLAINSATERPSTLYCLDMKNLKLDDCCYANDTPSSSSLSSGSCVMSGDSCYSSSPELSSSSSVVVVDNGNPLTIAPTENESRTAFVDPFRQSRCEIIDQASSLRNSTVGRLPAQIKPYLFLGNSVNSSDLDTLEKHNIKYILNVTPNLPNVFEQDGKFHYLKIPIDDHWSQNLFDYFPVAINFIDEARSKRCGVLVHCLAGISRSVTVIVAYLMHKFSMNLEDAYDLVKRHKPNIAPNLNFMGQLLEYQQHLFGGNPPDSVDPSPPEESADAVEEQPDVLYTPLSAPPTTRRAKQITKCF